MLSFCFFCDLPLGTNPEIEEMPVGRRLAFDERRGRLWVVCVGCGRWNLVPAEDRWEAIEACERRFRQSRVRFCTDEIGLARLASGVDLVRIGKPLLPEFAAWRWGNSILRRRRSLIARLSPKLGAPAVLIGAPLLTMTLGPAGAMVYAGLVGVASVQLRRRPALTIPLSSGEELVLSQAQVSSAELIRAEDEEEQWAMWIGCAGREVPRSVPIEETVAGPKALLTGSNGRVAASRILPHLSPEGGDHTTVREAVHWLEAVGGPERALHTFARSRWVRPALDAIERTLVTVHPEARLGLEMALHEAEERRALEGELTVLRWAWHREEALAEIVDGI